MKLRSYQLECLAAIEAAGNGRWLCQLATGMGKTVIFSQIPIRKHTLILSHRRELVMQPLKFFCCPTSVEMGLSSNVTLLGMPATPVTSASVQTMSRRLLSYRPDAFDTIIVDEAHHAASHTYRDILDYFRPERLIGFTATPNRADGLGLEYVFDKIIYKKDLRWGIENCYLSPIRAKRVNIGYDLSSVAVRMGDYAPHDLERAVNTDSSNRAIAAIVAAIPKDELPALIFCVDVAHAHAVAKAINDRMQSQFALALSAESKDRDAVVADYKAGKISVLVNCALFTEGTDLPGTRTVIIARPTKSAALYTQMAGRGTRLAEGKDYCTLIDCVGVSDLPLCSAPTLLGLDLDSVPARYKQDIEGDLLKDIPALIEQKTDTPDSWIRNVEIIDLWSKQTGYVLHDVNYIRRSDGSLILRLPDVPPVSITAPDLTGTATLSAGNYVATLPAQECYDRVFSLLRDYYLDKRPLWSLSSAKRWGRAPANEKQLAYVQRLATRKHVDISHLIPTLTKLQASSLIERLKV